MKLYIIAGEASGDLHGGNLIKAIKRERQDVVFRCWGGDLMQEALGFEVVKHYKDLAFMGFWEVFSNIKTILHNIRWCKKDILDFKPDALILIDYPGFNLRIASFAKKRGIKVLYYISPQIWAWKESRIHKIKRSVDKMFVILPFEKNFYKKWNYDVVYVGHPLLDAIQDSKHRTYTPINFNRPLVLLMPGSRKQEISKMLFVFAQLSLRHPTCQFVVAGLSHIEHTFYQNCLNRAGAYNIPILYDMTYDLLKVAHAAIVTSGTATLETALHGVPQVVGYKGSWLSYQIGKHLVQVNYISLVNLISRKEVVKELIQNQLTVDSLSKELSHLLDKGVQLEYKKIYAKLIERLRVEKRVSAYLARCILDEINI